MKPINDMKNGWKSPFPSMQKAGCLGFQAVAEIFLNFLTTIEQPQKQLETSEKKHKIQSLMFMKWTENPNAFFVFKGNYPMTDPLDWYIYLHLP